MIEEKKKIEEDKIELGSIDDFDTPSTTSPGMVVVWIVVITLMVASITMRLLV